MLGDIEDGWGSCSPVVASSPLRLAAKTRRSTSPGFAGGGLPRLSSTGEAGGGGATRSGVTEGAGSFKPERIGSAQTLKFHSVQLRETFDVGAHACEVAEAGEEVEQVFRARRNAGALEALGEWDAGDLAGACGDRGAHEMRVDLNRAGEIPAGLFVVLERETHVLLHQVVRELRDRMARSGDALADRVRREEVA